MGYIYIYSNSKRGDIVEGGIIYNAYLDKGHMDE